MKNLLKIFLSVLLVISPLVGLVAYGLGREYDWLLFIATAYLVIALGVLSLGIMLFTLSISLFAALILSFFTSAPFVISICCCICLANIWNSFNGVKGLIRIIKA